MAAEITIDIVSETISIDAGAGSSAAQGYAAAAATSATAAATSETNAGTSETNAGTSATAAASSATDAETAQTAAETAQTAAETAQTAAETAETNAETAETNAAASADAAAASAAAAGLNWRDDWVTSTAYAISDGVRSDGYGSYICTSAHTSGASTEPGVGGSWETVWDIFAADAESGAAATDTAAGVVELATIAEVDTGTDTDRAITPAGLAGSALASAVTANTAKTSNATHTGDVTGATALTIADEAVTLAKMANLANARIIGRNTGGSGVPEALTEAQFKALFNLEIGTDVQAYNADLTKTVVSILVFNDSEDCATGDGAGDVFWRVPSIINGYNLIGVAASCQTAGTTGTMDIQIHNVTDTADMLSTKITIDSGETDSSTAATPAVINTSNDDVATGDSLRIDVDAVHTTEAKGLLVELTFNAA